MKRFFEFCLLMGLLLGCSESSTPPLSMGELNFEKMVIDPTVEGPAFLEVGDVNGDGKTDLILSSFGLIEGTILNPGRVDIYLGGDELGSFEKQNVMDESEEIYFPNDPILRDLDSDGDMDIVIGFGFLACNFLERRDRDGALQPPRSCGGLAWFEQDAGQWHRHDLIPPNDELFFHRTLFTDLDGDNIDDIIAVGELRPIEGKSGDKAVTFILPGLMPIGTYGDPIAVGEGLGSLPELYDVDGDGDLDLVSAEYFAGQDASFVWYERTTDDPMSEAGWVRRIISDDLGPSIQLSMIENFFGNGETIAVGSNHSNTSLPTPDVWVSGIYVLRPGDDVRLPWTSHLISRDIVSRPISNQAAPGVFNWGDIDNDGDLDLIVSGDGDARIFVLEQLPDQTFETWTLESDVPQAGGLRVIDLGGSSQPEIVIASFESNLFQLYTPTSSPGQRLTVTETPTWTEPLPQTPVRVHFDEALMGPLIIAVFEDYPPTTAPIGFKLAPMPVSGETYEVNFSQEGTYKLFALIDVDGSGPMGLTEGDAYAVLEVDFPVNTTVDLFLEVDPVAPEEQGNTE